MSLKERIRSLKKITASEILIDQEQSNVGAVHVYEKAGFQIVDKFIASWHPVPHYKMRLYGGKFKERAWLKQTDYS